MNEFPQLDSGLAVPVFTQGYYPIAYLNKAMAFLSAVAASRFPSTNNQLRTLVCIMYSLKDKNEAKTNKTKHEIRKKAKS
ncbi:hypothetical protein Tco_0323571 [Tanacetum coccineum]